MEDNSIEKFLLLETIWYGEKSDVVWWVGISQDCTLQ